jgi:hypothetical protein
MLRSRAEIKFDAQAKIENKIWGLFLTVFICALVFDAPVALVRALDDVANIAVISTLSSFIGLAAAIIAMPVWAAVKAMFLRVARGGDYRDISVLKYYREKKYAEIMKAKSLICLYGVLGFICFIIPGFYFMIKYSMIDFVFADDPDLDYHTAMEKAKMLTESRRWDIFVFFLSFLGWDILCVLTAGILSIYVIPYEGTAFALLYDSFAVPEITVTDGGADAGYSGI